MRNNTLDPFQQLGDIGRPGSDRRIFGRRARRPDARDFVACRTEGIGIVAKHGSE